MKRLTLALLCSGILLTAIGTAHAEGRRMLIFAMYGPDGTTGSAATTTVIDFTTQIACRDARNALQRDRNLRTPGFRVIATCVSP